MTNIEKLKQRLEERGARFVGVSWGPNAAAMTPDERAAELLKFFEAEGELVGAYGPWYWRAKVWAVEYARRFRNFLSRVDRSAD